MIWTKAIMTLEHEKKKNIKNPIFIGILQKLYYRPDPIQ